jgi:hypothetical protein
VITEEEAVELARHAVVGKSTLEPGGPVETRREGDSFVVTFVHVNAPGVRGPDFDAQVTIDASSGEVTRILGAS